MLCFDHFSVKQDSTLFNRTFGTMLDEVATRMQRCLQQRSKDKLINIIEHLLNALNLKKLNSVRWKC